MFRYSGFWRKYCDTRHDLEMPYSLFGGNCAVSWIIGTWILIPDNYFWFAKQWYLIFGTFLIAVVLYEVTIVTGDVWNASTSASVYVTIYGEKGDSGVRQLYRSKTGTQNNFQMGLVSNSQLAKNIVIKERYGIIQSCH